MIDTQPSSLKALHDRIKTLQIAQIHSYPLDRKLKSQELTFFLEMTRALSKWPSGQIVTNHDFALAAMIRQAQLRVSNGFRDCGSAQIITNHTLSFQESFNKHNFSPGESWAKGSNEKS